jgi:hypothetical protein
MPEVNTLLFPNNKKGQAQKVLAVKEHAAAGWTVISETITPGHLKSNEICGLSGSDGGGIITVTLIKN